MSNPVPAFKNTSCDECGSVLEEGEDLFFTDDGRLCTDCADSKDYICDCGNFKKQEYGTCFECKDDQ